MAVTTLCNSIVGLTAGTGNDCARLRRGRECKDGIAFTALELLLAIVSLLLSPICGGLLLLLELLLLHWLLLHWPLLHDYGLRLPLRHTAVVLGLIDRIGLKPHNHEAVTSAPLDDDEQHDKANEKYDANGQASRRTTVHGIGMIRSPVAVVAVVIIVVIIIVGRRDRLIKTQ